jgi:hypothetical protein
MAKIRYRRKRALALLILLDLIDAEFAKKKEEGYLGKTMDRKKERICVLSSSCKREFLLQESVTTFLLCCGQNTIMRESIGSDERMAGTFRFLASGETFKSLNEYSFRISRTALSRIVIETSQSTHQIIGANNLKIPSSTNDLP